MQTAHSLSDYKVNVNIKRTYKLNKTDKFVIQCKIWLKTDIYY
ncbi:MAG: hypothetical protein UT00_C0002G0065 [Parcubacteria group bacterium GW2011_GWA1_38_7]|nr:MAG: hypothetical protein UT00_C0002G0065 [Parcubacteria group bacterium GW2011_GWA1_38_7]